MLYDCPDIRSTNEPCFRHGCLNNSLYYIYYYSMIFVQIILIYIYNFIYTCTFLITLFSNQYFLYSRLVHRQLMHTSIFVHVPNYLLNISLGYHYKTQSPLLALDASSLQPSQVITWRISRYECRNSYPLGNGHACHMTLLLR